MLRVDYCYQKGICQVEHPRNIYFQQNDWQGTMHIHMSCNTPKRILFIRPSALGDVCRSVSVVTSLKKRWPEASIDWLVQTEFVDAVSAHPAIENVIPFPRQAMRRWYTPKGLFLTLRFLRILKSKKYDLVIDGQGLGRSGIFTWSTRAGVRIGLASAREFGWLGYTKKVQSNCKHTVDQMLALSEAAGAPSITDMQLYTHKQDEVWWESFKEKNRVTTYAVLAPTSRWKSKQWPVERFVSLADHFVEKGLQVVIVGAPHERDQIAPLLEHVKVINVLPEMTIGRLMAVITSSTFVVANDSAALHIAVGFNRPCVGLFGPTDPSKVGPYKCDNSVIAADVEYGEVNYRDCAGNQIMQQIDIQEVIDRIETICKQDIE